VEHEEVLSANEELQSTNEELETAKEELQSSNEELSTLNAVSYTHLHSDDLSSMKPGHDVLKYQSLGPNAASLWSSAVNCRTYVMLHVL